MLIEKNQKYGNSALEPLGVFSKLSPEEGLMIRIDDKLKRIKNGSLDKDDEDVINDLIGYLVLLKIHANSKYEPNEALKEAAEKHKEKAIINLMTDPFWNGIIHNPYIKD